MKKFILLLTCFFCLSTSVFAEMNFAPSLSAGFKANNLSTGIEFYDSNSKGNSYNLIKWAGLRSKPSAAIDFDLEWYNNDNPFYFGFTIGLSAGGVFSLAENLKFGLYNNYVNLFCKIGTSTFYAKMDAGEPVEWSRNSYGNSYKIESINFYDIGFNFGIGLDLHPTKGPFFIRMLYNHEIYTPDLEINTSKFTDLIESEEIYGDNDFHNRSFTISVGWQFRRKNIVKEDVPEDKKSSEKVPEASFKFDDVPTMVYSDLCSMILNALFEKGIIPIEESTIKEAKD